MKKLFIALLACFLAGCHNPSERKLAISDGSCKYTGNIPGHAYCVTTFIQLLANPEKYDGKRIRLQAWALNYEKSVVLFPSLDLAEGGQNQSSLVIVSGEKINEINKYIDLRSASGEPIRMQVGGIFRLNRDLSGGKMKLQGYDATRFGSLEQVDDWFF